MTDDERLKARLAWSERRWIRWLAAHRGAPLGLALAALVLALTFLSDADALRMASFDALQRAFPRERDSQPAVIVAVDEKSLAELGQWPWPRHLTAALITRIAAARPAALGVDILFPERDRLSPETLAMSPAVDDALRARLMALPRHDTQLARALAASPSALAVAGLESAPERSGDVVRGSTPVFLRGGTADELTAFPASLRSIAEIDDAAPGRGLISGERAGRVVRRVPLTARVEGTLVPALSVEMLRLAAGVPAISLEAFGGVARAVVVGDLRIPVSPDGALWLRFSGHDPARFVSAVDVLAGRVDPDMFERKLVLLGVTAIGLLDYHVIATGERVPGVEIHAEVLENIFDGHSLSRPAGMAWLERLLLAALAVAAVVAATRLQPRLSAMALAAGLALLAVAAFAAFRAGVLFDAAWPAIGGGVAYAMAMVGTAAEVDRQRRNLQRSLDAERIAAARMLGEQEAARQIQARMLPAADGRGVSDLRVAVAAAAEPARSVGGDFYDYFLVNDDRLFFVLGDVSGKGVPAALFMSTAKALLKSAALREPPRVEAIVDAAHAELFRDNTGQMFVTAVCGLLHLDTGSLEWICAGHEAPVRLHAGGLEPLAGESGPPLCVIEAFPYETNQVWLEPGDRVCVVSDGVLERQGPRGALYGRERFLAALAGETPSAVRDALLADVETFAAGTERNDDATVLVLQWNGGGADA